MRISTESNQKESSDGRLSASRSKIRRLLQDVESPQHETPLDGRSSLHHCQFTEDPTLTNPIKISFIDNKKSIKTTVHTIYVVTYMMSTDCIPPLPGTSPFSEHQTPPALSNAAADTYLRTQSTFNYTSTSAGINNYQLN